MQSLAWHNELEMKEYVQMEKSTNHCEDRNVNLVVIHRDVIVDTLQKWYYQEMKHRWLEKKTETRAFREIYIKKLEVGKRDGTYVFYIQWFKRNTQIETSHKDNNHSFFQQVYIYQHCWYCKLLQILYNSNFVWIRQSPCSSGAYILLR